MRLRTQKSDATPAVTETPAAQTASVLGEGPLVLCDAHDTPIVRIEGEKWFRVTWQGRQYEHFAEDASGRWLYRPF